MSENVFVTNNSDNKFVTEFCYKQIEFPVGKPVQISVIAAKHIFGYGDNNKEPYLARLGWIQLHSELEQGLERLSKFEISDKPLVEEDRSLPSAVGVVPLHVEKRGGGATRHRVA
jgi:hypothetical protein